MLNKVLFWLIGFAVVFLLASIFAPRLVNEFLNTLRDLLTWLIDTNNENQPS